MEKLRVNAKPSWEECFLSGQLFPQKMWLYFWVFATALLALGIGFRDPWPADEPRFALVAKQMLESGQWLVPMRGGEIYPDKPPMFMWFIAFFLKMTGSVKISFLMPSFLASIGTLALTTDLAKRLWNNSVAFFAGVLLLLTLQFTLQAKVAQIDALVSFFIFLGVYGFVRFLNKDGWRWYYLGWFAAGLGVITKGVGIIALLVLIPAIYTHWQSLVKSSLVTKLKLAAGFAVMLGAICIWFLPIVLFVSTSSDTAHHAYLDNILFKQTVTRYSNSWHHVKPFWYYLVNVIPVFWLPLSLAIPFLVPSWRRAIKEHDDRIILLLGWVICVLLFFSFSPGKRGVYLTPALPALALIAAPYYPMILNKRWLAWLWHCIGLILSIALISAGIFLKVSPEKIAQNVGEHVSVLWPAFLVVGICLLAFQFRLRKTAITSFLISLSVIWIFYSTVLYAALNDFRTPKQIMNQLVIETQFSKSTEVSSSPPDVLFIDFKEQFLLFSKQPLWHFGFHVPASIQVNDASAWLQQTKGYVVGPKELLAKCFDLEGTVVLGDRHREQWRLVRASEINDTCRNQVMQEAPFRYDPSFMVD